MCCGEYVLYKSFWECLLKHLFRRLSGLDQLGAESVKVVQQVLNNKEEDWKFTIGTVLYF